jgi:hypothetical protein
MAFSSVVFHVFNLLHTMLSPITGTGSTMNESRKSKLFIILLVSKQRILQYRGRPYQLLKMQKNTPKLKMQQQLLHVVPHRSPIVQ